MFTNSHIQASHSFTMIGPLEQSRLKLIKDIRSKNFGSSIVTKLLPYLVLFLNAITIYKK